MITREVEPPVGKKIDSQSPSISSLPDEILENCLARISKWNYPNLSLVSKRFLSLLSSPHIYTTRSQIGTIEPCFYFCLELHEHQSPQWFTLWMKPNETLTDNDEILNDYTLLPLHSSSNSPPVPYASTVEVGSEIYLIGAPFELTPSSAVRILDCRSHTWRDGPSMKVARGEATAVYLDGKIYVMGGYEEDDESMAWMEVLDIKTQTWSFLASNGADELRCDDRCLSMSVLQGKIYAMDHQKIHGKLYAYDPKKDTLEVVETLSRSTLIYAWCGIENVMYCYTASNSCMWYDSKSRKWREVKGSNLKVLLESRTRCLSRVCVVDLFNCSGKLLVVWMARVHGKQKRRIKCTKMALEKRHGGEVWVKMEWDNTLLTVPKSVDDILSCVVVSI
ncbi:Kelch repeat type 1 [Arabidopsis thaliana x Arabidopsis arenosa]|uniref:Kelch repeat type 1 n=1 Tax=Arabidopsis thaliana x Arabidopsis arenosa TaxID=1240361 RepID=A0A8T1Y337_9BRAS|nr:Kelch repeat type 1 [Arabidopsis thaliana x Arabidopsis arenosa]